MDVIIPMNEKGWGEKKRSQQPLVKGIPWTQGGLKLFSELSLYAKVTSSDSEKCLYQPKGKLIELPLVNEMLSNW